MNYIHTLWESFVEFYYVMYFMIIPEVEYFEEVYFGMISPKIIIISSNCAGKSTFVRTKQRCYNYTMIDHEIWHQWTHNSGVQYEKFRISWIQNFKGNICVVEHFIPEWWISYNDQPYKNIAVCAVLPTKKLAFKYYFDRRYRGLSGIRNIFKMIFNPAPLTGIKDIMKRRRMVVKFAKRHSLNMYKDFQNIFRAVD